MTSQQLPLQLTASALWVGSVCSSRACPSSPCVAARWDGAAAPTCLVAALRAGRWLSWERSNSTAASVLGAQDRKKSTALAITTEVSLWMCLTASQVAVPMPSRTPVLD